MSVAARPAAGLALAAALLACSLVTAAPARAAACPGADATGGPASARAAARSSSMKTASGFSVARMFCNTSPGTATISAYLPASSVPVSPSMPSSVAAPMLLVISAAAGVMPTST